MIEKTLQNQQYRNANQQVSVEKGGN